MKTEEAESRRALEKALRLLSFRDRSRHEMLTGLRERGFTEPVLSRTIDRLIELKYLDDANFAVRYARHLAVNRLYGNRRIEIALREKGIAAELARRGIAQAREELDEKDAAALLIAKKTRGRKLKQLSPSEKRKIAQFLIGKGFSPALGYEFLGESGLYKEDDV